MFGLTITNPYIYLGGCVQTSPGYSFNPLEQEQAHHQELKAKVGQLQATHTTLRRNMKRVGPEFSSGSGARGCNFGSYVHLHVQLLETLLVHRTWYVLALCQPTLQTNLDPLNQFELGTMRPWAGGHSSNPV